MKRYPSVSATGKRGSGWYQDRHGDRYGEARLWEMAKGLPAFDCPLAALDLSDQIWVGCCIADMAEHCKQVMDADLRHPIILDWEGAIADGRHRVIKALCEGRTTIKAVRLTYKPQPCKPAEGG